MRQRPSTEARPDAASVAMSSVEADVAGGEAAPRGAEARRLIVEALREDTASPFRAFFRHWLLTVLPIAVALAMAVAHPSIATWIVAAVVTGFAQNALGLLMHEGSHFFFHSDRRLNDLIADALVCLPIFNTVEGYRVPHLDHHRWVGTTRDPYFTLYAEYGTRARLLRMLLGDLVLAGAFAKFTDRYIAGEQPRAALDVKAAAVMLLVQGALFVFYAAITDVWYAYVVLWLLPLMVVPQVVNRIRTVAEHAPEIDEAGGANRSTVVRWLEYLLIAPYGYAFHFEHHLAPSVPYYRLASAHRLLVEHGHAFTRRELTDGYVRTFLRLLRALKPSS